MREHWNDLPGDIAGEDAENLPGGFGTDNPDASPDATVDEKFDLDIQAAAGAPRGFTTLDQHGGTTSGTGFAATQEDGGTVDMEDLLVGEEGHPGAGVGFTGRENDKRGPEGPLPHEEQGGPSALGGAEAREDARTPQEAEDISVESEGPFGAEGAGGAIGEQAA